jgi:multicomponent Na+:H+ antiporter subunit D
MDALLPLAIVVPLMAAAVTLILHRAPLAQRIIAVVAAVASFGISIAVLVTVDREGSLATNLGDWPPPIAINLVADRFAALMLFIGTAMLLAVLLYALGQRAQDERSPWYTPVYLVLMAGVSAAFLAGDLFNLFVAVEVLLMSSYVLITLEGNDTQIRSGTTYVVINVLESMLLLLAIALIFAATGTLSMAELPERLAALPDGVALGLNLMLLIAFGLKAAVFPLFSWLPDSYPAAPSPVTAVFAGLLTKIGVYALIRTETLLFPGGQRTLLLWVAGFTMIIGVLGAIAQSDMKRILSFHIVSQIGYMILGLAIGGVAAIAATIFFVLHQIPIKTSLFLVEGIVERDTGSSTLDRVGGMARRSGLLALLFILPALSLAGLPPFSGFVGKVGLVEAGFGDGAWAITAVALAGSLLTLVSMLKIWSGVFWGDPQPDPRGREGVLRYHPLASTVTAAVVVFGLAIALFAGPVYRFCERAAEQVVEPATYAEHLEGT